MGRGGEGVGCNWRGVALTHQATVYKNKTGGQGNGTEFLFFPSSLNTSLHCSKKDCGNKIDTCFLSDVSPKRLSLTHLRLSLRLTLLIFPSLSPPGHLDFHNPASAPWKHL